LHKEGLPCRRGEELAAGTIEELVPEHDGERAEAGRFD
jgi:hypothetical protein